MITQIKRWLLGSPLDTKSELHERLNVFLGLAIFASDALSSSAYATDEILFALVGMISVSSSQSAVLADQTFDVSNLYLCIPVACMIAMLLGIVIVSYRQVINAYPDGGGAYVVAKENLGTQWSLLAAASLMVDYILTVAVSVSAGVAAITATFHATNATQAVAEEHTSMTLAVVTILVIMHMNLRGIKESARVIAIPAYLFLSSMVGLIVIGVFRTLVFEHHSVVYQGIQIGVEHIAVGLLFLKAFAHGCAALTGIEAISNGVKAFDEPAEVTANKTMVLMGAILGFIFIGLTYLALAYQIIPVEGDTVVSQVARAVFGGQNLLYYIVQWATMTILVLAANTSFGGFPRLAMLLARDGFLPRQLMNVGDRLVYSNGVVLLASAACFLVLAFHASVHNLMPMYAIGVFLSFTLAQAGMVVHHKRKNEGKAGYRRMTVNTVGASATGAVCLLLCLEKFTAGAWIVLIALPVLMWIFRRINNHYRTTSALLSLPKDGYHPRKFDHTVLVLVASLNRGAIPALEYAKSISPHVEAVHVQLDAAATEQLRKDWNEWGCGIPLKVLQSPYRSLSGPMLKYIDEVSARHDHDIVTIVIPELVPNKWWHHLLHNQTAIAIKTMLLFRPGKVVTTIKYRLNA